MAKNFDILRAPIMADPIRRAQVEQHKRAMCDVLALAELRETQRDVTDALGVTEANFSQIERQEDIYLSTLSSYVHALGGRLGLTAVFPDGSVALVEPDLKRKQSSDL